MSHRRAWWQDPLIRTWLFPPAVGAGLGIVFGIALDIVSFIRSFFVFNADVPNLLNLPFDALACGYIGIHFGLIASALIQFCKLPQKQRHSILKALWKVVYVLVILFAILMSFGLLSGLLSAQLNRRF